eukprot:g7481.t1
MPTSNSRSRRARVRSTTSRDKRTPVTVPASTSRTVPEEAESQQQSSNKCTSNKTEDKKSTLGTPTKRKKKPPEVRNKGTIDSQIDDTLCSSVGASLQETEGEPSTTRVKCGPSKGRRRRVVRNKSTMETPMDDPSAPSQMEVESEGENRVSESEVLPIETQMSTPTPIKGEFPFDVYLDSKGVHRALQAVFVLPICIGSIAFWQGKKAPEKKCYRWAVYVRSPARVDVSHIIKRVRFQLHPSFPQPERIIEKPPYELEETGWGEFEVVVGIEFHSDAHESPVELTHSLKLYTTSEPSTKRPVVSEKYDEIVFSEPSASFFYRIRQEPDKKPPMSKFESFFPNYDSHLVDDCMHRINLVRSKIRNEIRVLKAKAEANGIEIPLPEDYTTNQEEDESLHKNKKQSESTRKTSSKSFKGPSSKKMRLILDACNKANPLRIEAVHSHRSMQGRQQVQETGDMEQGLDDALIRVEGVPPRTFTIKSETMEIDEKGFKPLVGSEMEASCSEEGTSTKSRMESKTSRKETDAQFTEECDEDLSSNEGDDLPEMNDNPQTIETQDEKLDSEIVPQEEVSEEMQSEDESDSSFDGMSDTQNANDFDIEDDD